ncbi:MAG: potassium channel protein [Saprospiraceae bacterium]|nr:potassium channel protein [Saprospiraceae bacterium]
MNFRSTSFLKEAFLSNLSIQLAFLLFFSSLLIGTFGYMLVEGYDLLESFYMTVITLSTVGYGEVRPLSDLGRVFTAFYILLNVGIFTYSISVFYSYVLKGEFLTIMNIKQMEKQISRLEGHTIICGFGRHGQEMAEHFERHKTQYVIVDRSEEQLIAKRTEFHKNLLYVVGDATEDEVLEKANIRAAAHLIAALPDDTENLYIVLSARQLCPSLDIVSRYGNPRSEKKLRLAGANKVLMPEQIGGFYMATLISKPGAIDFLSYVSSDELSDIGLEEYAYEDMKEEVRTKSLADMNYATRSGAHVVVYHNPDGTFEINPPGDTRIREKGSIVALGNKAQLEAFKEIVSNN